MVSVFLNFLNFYFLALAMQLNECAHPRKQIKKSINSHGVPRMIPREQRKFVRLRLTKSPDHGLI